MTRLPLLLIAVIALVAPPAQAQAGGWIWPVDGEVITPYRNGDDPYAAGQHRGIDIAAPAGERVVAATAGTVTFAGVAGSSGLTVAVRTADGAYDTSYLHLSSRAVERDDVLRAGDTIGAVGTSGRRSAEAPHLHFGVRDAGDRHAYLDPLGLLGPRPAPRGEPRDPSPTGTRVPRLFPLESGLPEPAGEPAPAPSPAGDAHPAAHPEAPPRPHTHPQPEPRTFGPAPSPLVAAVDDPGKAARPEVTAPSRTAPRRSGGIDLGWLAACLGLLAVAGSLGRWATHPRRRDPIRAGRRAAAA